MSGFRHTLDDWLQGRASPDAVERELADELRRDPRLTPAALALIEGYRRAGRVPAPLAQRLSAVAANPDLVRPAAVEAKTRFRGVAPATPAVVDDRTRLKPLGGGAAPAAPASTPDARSAGRSLEPDIAPAVQPDRTILRPRAANAAAGPTPRTRSPPEAALPPAEAPADRTILKPRARPEPAAAPPDASQALAASGERGTPFEAAADPATRFRPIAGRDSAAAPPGPGDPATRLKPAAATGSPPPPSDHTAGGSTRGPATGSTQGTGTSSWNWTGGAASAGAAVGIGSVLKERYVLESIVPGGDKGGMGVVFCARDRINEEAQDRNPFVAVKVLNEEFKRHPESMKALQREAKKAQTLAHPNIITVFNFDRDQGNVFMVMELLEGTPLNELIKSVKDKGLPKHEAVRIILALARALAYAHERRIVHSDFKPGNAFLTKEGQVKVLDFGIARAAKAPEGDARRGSGDDKTLFDAASLGAFTPPYASCEQIEGREPDPRDDVYALGVVSYELLCGRHPFDRKDSVTARTEGLSPAPLRGLDRRQWRTLHAALAFDQARRPPNGLAFGDGMTPRHTPVAVIVSSAVALLLLIVALSIFVPNFLERRQAQSIANDLASSTPAVSAAAVQRLQAADQATRTAAVASEASKTKVLAVYERLVRAYFDPAARRYDFAAANRILEEDAPRLLPDSAALGRLLGQLQTEEKREITERSEEFEKLLSARQLIAEPGAPSVIAVREVLRRLEPKHSLLADSRVPIAFRDAARAALDRQDSAGADRLLKAGLLIAPSDPNLRDLEGRVARARESTQLAAQIGALERTIAPLAAPTATLADFRAANDALGRMRTASVTNVMLVRAEHRLDALVAAEIAAQLEQRNADAAQQLLTEFQPFLAVAFVDTQNTAIRELVGEAKARSLAARQHRDAIDRLLATPRPDDGWIRELRGAVAKLNEVAPRDPKIGDAGQRASRYLLDQAKALRGTGRLSEAARLVTAAHDVGGAEAEVKVEESTLARAREQLEADNSAKQRESQLAAQKARVIDLAGAGGGRLDDAEAKYRELVKQLPAGDQWAVLDAPHALADGFLRRALVAAQAGKFAQALEQAHRIDALPADSKYAGSVATFEGYATLAARLQGGTLDGLVSTIGDLQRRDAKLFDAVKQALTGLLAGRVSMLAQEKPSEAQKIKSAAEALFPGVRFPDVRPVEAPIEHKPTLPPVAPPTPARVDVERPKPTEEVATTRIEVAPPGRQTQAAAPGGGRPCTADLAGKGNVGEIRGGCFDLLGVGGRGPDLVVISAGGHLYAIMRNEVSNGDFAKYCVATGCSAPPASMAALPVTTIPVNEAGRFAEWMSQQTGSRYRLPTESEWVAAAGTSFDPNGVNCVFGPRGTSVREVGKGAMNEFGLRDVIGNVREWVATEGGGWKARGGAFGDALNDCLRNPAVPHSGLPDGRTGFRLVRDIK